MALPIDELIDGMRSYIQKNLVAKAVLTSDASTSVTTISVDNAFRFLPNEEIVILDETYNNSGSLNFDILEYAVVKEVVDTRTIELLSPIEQTNDGGWTVGKGAFIQKTIGHTPLFTDQVYYGDRDVVVKDDVSITIAAGDKSSEWIAIQGMLSNEYNLSITIYIKDIDTEDGERMLHKYCDALENLFLQNIHLDIDDYNTPLVRDAVLADDFVFVENTAENRDYFKVSESSNTPRQINIQDNLGATTWYSVNEIEEIGSELRVTLSRALQRDFKLDEFAILTKLGRYIYDSRASGINYGFVTKGSALLRAGQLSWFGKETEGFCFPQRSRGADDFDRITP
jgi:hypothetical protein